MAKLLMMSKKELAQLEETRRTTTYVYNLSIPPYRHPRCDSFVLRGGEGACPEWSEGNAKPAD